MLERGRLDRPTAYSMSPFDPLQRCAVPLSFAMPTFMTILAILLPLIVATLLAIWLGWGVARLTLPPSLHPLRSLLAPLIGYCLMLVVGYWHVRTNFSLLVALVVLLPLTGLLNLVAWRTNGPLHPERVVAEWPILVILAATLAIGIAPLFSYGYAGVIGAGWDLENYLPTTRYLMQGPVSAIASAPSNPLRDLNAHPPAIGLTLGFSIWQGSVDLLSHSESLASFAPLLAWLRMLGVLAVYIALRTMLGLSRAAALLGAALTSAGALLLWVSFFNFGMQLAAWPLIALVLLLGLASASDLAQRGIRAYACMLPPALALAAVPVAYYPALTLLAPLVVALGAVVVRDHSEPKRLLLAAGAIGGLALMLALPTVSDYYAGFDYRYSNTLTTLGVFEYLTPDQILGLSPFSRPDLAATDPLLVQIAWCGLLLLAGVAAWRMPQRSLLLALLVGAVFYLGWLRWWQQYPYAFMKGSAYVGWVLAALIAAGWELAWRMRHWLIRGAASLVAALLLLVIGQSQLRVVAAHLNQPGLYAKQLPALQALRQLVPAGSTVLMSADTRIQGLPSGLAAYFLDHTTVIGRTRTAYTSSTFGQPGETAPYALLADDEDPTPWGYTTPIWHGGGFALYQRPDQILDHLRVEQMLHSGDAHQLAFGDQRLGVNSPGSQQFRELAFEIASLTTAQVMIEGKRYDLTPGSTTIRVDQMQTPGWVEIRNTGSSSILLRCASLRLGDSLASQTGTVDDGMLIGPLVRTQVRPNEAILQARSQVVGAAFTTSVDLLLQDGGPLVLALDIWDRTQNRPYGWYGVPVGMADGVQQVTLTIDLTTGQAQATRDGVVVPLGSNKYPLQPGSYTAQLLVGTDTSSFIRPVDLFTFDVAEDHSITNTWAGVSGILAASLERPIERVGMLLDDDTLLEGYSMRGVAWRAGDAVLFDLWWRVRRPPQEDRSVLIHLLDAQGNRVAQGDGPPAAGALATSTWRPGNLLIDSRRLELPADLPPGDYTILVGMYRWPSLERLSMHYGEQRQPDDVLRIPLRVVR